MILGLSLQGHLDDHFAGAVDLHQAGPGPSFTQENPAAGECLHGVHLRLRAHELEQHSAGLVNFADTAARKFGPL